MPADLADLCFEFHYGCDLADADVLAQLQVSLGRLAPRMSATLEVHAYERDRGRRYVDVTDPDALRAAVVAKGTERGPTFQALMRNHGASGGDRRFGHVLLRGRGPGSSRVFLSIDFDSMVPARPVGRAWLWSNSIGGRLSAPRVEVADRQEWVCQLAEELTTTTTMLWGAGHLHPEFASSNLDTREGMRAIGRDVRTALPGVYWLNIFGPPYLDLIGEQRLLRGPAETARRSGDHVTIRTYRDAEDWEANDKARNLLKAALGAEHFFDRNAPTRRYRAPDLGLADCQASHRFRCSPATESTSRRYPDRPAQKCPDGRIGQASTDVKFREACVRCPMLRLDLQQVPRLLQIESNTHERLDEARRVQWLSEVAALDESLHHISRKKQQVDRLRQQTELGESSSTALG